VHATAVIPATFISVEVGASTSGKSASILLLLPGDYWMTATVAEVQLIRHNYQQAANLYEEAVAIAPEETGSHKSTWKQAQLLMDKLETPANDRAQIAKAFAHLE